MDSDLEFDINEILADIKDVDIKTTEDIHIRNNEILDIVYSKFLKYEVNIENIKKAKETILNLEYEYVEDLSDLKARDSFFGINLTHFYNLKLEYLGIFIKIKDTVMYTTKFRKFYPIKYDDYIFFRKLNSENKVKLLLLDSINKMNQ